jgi:phage-related protein
LIDLLAGKFGEVGKNIGELWPKIQEGLGKFLTWAGEQVEQATKYLSEWWTKHGQSVEKTVGFITRKIGEFVNWASSTIAPLWERIAQNVNNAWEQMKRIIGGALEIIGNLFDAAAAAIEGDWATFWAELQTSAGIAWDLIYTTVQQGLDATLNLFGGKLSESQEAWTYILGTFVDIVGKELGKAQKLLDALGDAFKSAGINLFASFIAGVASQAQKLIDAIVKPVQDALKIVNDLLGGIGGGTTGGKGGGGQGRETAPIGAGSAPNLSAAVGQARANNPASAGLLPVVVGGGTSINITMGQVNISGPMDLAAFQSQLTRTIKTAMGK